MKFNLIIFSLLFLKSSISSAKAQDFNPDLSMKIAKQILNLSQKLVEKNLMTGDDKTIAMSPISVSAALQLCLLGAHGKTFDELKSVLGYNETSSNFTQIHMEFAHLLQDFLTEKTDPTRVRSNPPWKQEFSQKFEEKLSELKPEDQQYEISFANGVFLHTNVTVRPDYEAAVKTIYNSTYKPINYTMSHNSSKYVNDWVANETHGKIKELISGRLTTRTKLILANALYFNAKWLYSCSKEKLDFYPDGIGKPGKVVDMIKFDDEFPFYNLPNPCNVRAIGFPYQKNTTTLYVFLPLDSDREKIKQAQKCLTADKMNEIIDQMISQEVKAWLPEFHSISVSNFKDHLKELGLVTLFKENSSDLSLIVMEKNRNQSQSDKNLANGQSALLNLDKIRDQNKNMTINRDLFVADIVHRVNLKVTEEGTEGAAATLVSGMQVLRVAQKIIIKEEFKVDAPFIFLLKHDLTRVSLFYGVVNEPIFNGDPKTVS